MHALKAILLLVGCLLSVSPAISASEDESDVAARPDPVDEGKPRWELGLAGAWVNGRDYPASKDDNTRLVALPYFIYRTPRLRVGDGVKAVAIENAQLRLDLSVAGSLNASSEKNSAREGMENIDFLGEIGPELTWRIPLGNPRDAESAAGDNGEGAVDPGRLTLGTELHAVFGIGGGEVTYRGHLLEFDLRYARRISKMSQLALFTGGSVTFASERLQDYYYEVKPQFERPDRPRYDAREGLLSGSVVLGITGRPADNLRFAAGVSLGMFGGAANADSPLHETNSSVTGFVGVIWRVARSRDNVLVHDLNDDL